MALILLLACCSSFLRTIRVGNGCAHIEVHRENSKQIWLGCFGCFVGGQLVCAGGPLDKCHKPGPTGQKQGGPGCESVRLYPFCPQLPEVGQNRISRQPRTNGLHDSTHRYRSKGRSDGYLRFLQNFAAGFDLYRIESRRIIRCIAPKEQGWLPQIFSGRVEKYRPRE